MADRDSGASRDGSPRRLREINDRAAIEALLDTGPATRAELEKRIGLSKPATASLLNRLEDSGMVVRGDPRGGQRGPRAQTWTVNGELAYVAGVHLTPESVHIKVVDIAGTTRCDYHTELPSNDVSDVPPEFAAAMRNATAVAGVEPQQIAHIVVGSPGAVNPRTGHLGFAPHVPGWEGFDMPGELRRILGTAVTVENDVNLAALEEMKSGAAYDVHDFVLLWLSRGIGAAVVVDRALLRGATGGAGEIDWMWVPDRAEWDTNRPSAGTRLGDLLSSASLTRLAAAHGLPSKDGPSAVQDALSAGQRGEEFLRDVARRIATGIAGIVSVIDPELVLLSAEVGQAGGTQLAELVSEELHALVVPRTPVAPAVSAGDPVRSGAVHVGLGLARRDLFGSGGGRNPSPNSGGCG